MKNRYEVRGATTVIFLRRKDGTFLETVIDTDDLEKAAQIRTWHAAWAKNTQSYYVTAYVQGDDGRPSSTKLHRHLMDCPDELDVDHRNHRTLDNRRLNLRIATPLENNHNRRGANRDSVSGVRGVSWTKNRQHWQVSAKLNGKLYYLGVYKDLGEATRVIKEWRAEHTPSGPEVESHPTQ